MLNGRLDPFGLLLPQAKWYNDDRALFLLGPGHPLREMGRLLATNPVFDSVVLVAISVGTVLLAYEVKFSGSI